jgi:hypothetical protein
VRVLVCGDRNWQDRAAIRRELEKLLGMSWDKVVYRAFRLGFPSRL